MANIIGTDNYETLLGTKSADTISGIRGDDTLTGGGGKDRFILAWQNLLEKSENPVILTL
ncbi:hypothetical protein NSTC745_04014 [Nostoc sp. DSM 114161]|jgi:Ca2+-binding RTX toxin-like protein|uniref:hypothetical protein n=1 Tax=Nostoc sp. DSM 114161 TaxID=3440143 RepID=UPI00404631B5